MRAKSSTSATLRCNLTSTPDPLDTPSPICVPCSTPMCNQEEGKDAEHRHEDDDRDSGRRCMLIAHAFNVRAACHSCRGSRPRAIVPGRSVQFVAWWNARAVQGAKERSENWDETPRQPVAEQPPGRPRHLVQVPRQPLGRQRRDARRHVQRTGAPDQDS
eukprot:3659420-Rhodomonas_salina.2